MARIALVHDIAGVAEVQARILRGAGHEVDHIRLPDFGARWPVLAKAITLPIRLALYLPTIFRLRRRRYDVIHIHWVSRGIIGLLVGKPFLIQAHGSDLHMHVDTPGMFELNRRVLEKARSIFYVTPNLASFIQRFESKLVYLPNPINVRTLADSPHPPQTVRRVLIFMRLDPVKGVEKVFPAVERLSSMVEVTALAWGPLTEQYVSRYGSFVNFVEPVPHAQIGPFLEQFDLVVGQMEQGVLGLSEIESMAAGKPLISGIDRSMYPVDKPPVVFADTPELLIEQIQVLKDDTRRLANLAYEGREWVRRNHGYERHLQLLESAYLGRNGVAQAA
jgi:glycosyltransferase involved in cell wall biosynthesis